MYPVSARFLAAVRNPPAIVTRMEVWRSGSRVDPYGADGLPVYAGEVQVDGSKLIRRTLSNVKVDATDDAWDLLSPPGTELRAFRGFRYSSGETEMVPVGRFVLEDLEESYGGDWDGSISGANDLMGRADRARFLFPRTFPAGMRIADVIISLVGELLGDVTNLASSQATLTSTAVYDRDRAKTLSDLTASIGATVFIAADGTPTLADLPVIGDPVWTIDTGDAGVLYQATRRRSLSQAYSAVVAEKSGVDGSPTFPPQVAYDDDPNSPTYYLGPFGLVPYFMASELFGNAGQALAAARAQLPLVTAPHAQVNLTAECNPALDVFDTVAVAFPRRLRGKTPATERQVVRTLTIPLTPDGVQSMTTMSQALDLPSSN